jgi:hypothetical protein
LTGYIVPVYAVTVYTVFGGYRLGAQMNPVNGTARITAAMVAVSVTLSMVWSMAALGYPTSTAAGPPLQQACAR